MKNSVTLSLSCVDGDGQGKQAVTELPVAGLTKAEVEWRAQELTRMLTEALMEGGHIPWVCRLCDGSHHLADCPVC